MFIHHMVFCRLNDCRSNVCRSNEPDPLFHIHIITILNNFIYSTSFFRFRRFRSFGGLGNFGGFGFLLGGETSFGQFRKFRQQIGFGFARNITLNIKPLIFQKQRLVLIHFVN